MKKYILITLAFAAIFASCEPAAEETPLSVLQEKRTKFISQIDSINVLMKDLDEQIAVLDTTKKVPLVSTMELQKTQFNHYFKVQGNVEADKNATLYPETPGLIKAIYVSEGQKVSAGQKLLAIDNDIIANSIAEVETNLNLAQDVFQRQERLWNQNIGSELQYLEAKNRVESLEKTIATLRKQQSMGLLRAPFSGIVDQIMPKVGEMGSPNAPAMKIVNLSKLHAKADVSEKYLAKVKNNTKVTIAFGEGLDTLEGKISRVGSSISPANRTFEITVDITEKSDFLRPNLMAQIEINDYQSDSALVIPSSYLLQDMNANTFVYVTKKEKDKTIATKKIITTGKSYNGNTEILSGLTGLETVITEGARKLVDGAEIQL